MLSISFNKDYLIWISFLPTIACLLIPMFYFWKKESYDEKGLVAISSDFQGINVKNFIGHLLWLGTAICLMLSLRSQYNYGLSVTVFASLATYHGLFALINGVYPVPKALNYYYDTSSEIRRIAKLQIFLSIALIAAAFALNLILNS